MARFSGLLDAGAGQEREELSLPIGGRLRNGALMVARGLRWLPRTEAFDRHLAGCAIFEVVHRAADPALPALTLRQVLMLDPLPRLRLTVEMTARLFQ